MKPRFAILPVYVAGSLLVLAALWLLFHLGPAPESTVSSAPTRLWEPYFQSLLSNLNQPVSQMVFQLLVVLGFCRACAFLLARLGQPAVIAEIFAGILLGKSAFAVLWPAGFAAVFPESTIPRLYALSQFGLIFFMFVVGLELNLETVRKRASSALLVSHASIVLPFVLGVALAVVLYDGYSLPGVSFTSFALFMGIAMSITAFPVLARILKDREMSNTPLGALALTCAAVDDVTAWCILAAVIGIVRAHGPAAFVPVLLATALYVVVTIKLVRPLLARLLRPGLDATFRREQFAVVFITILCSALVAEVIGIHALFGAFLAGTMMPRSESLRANLAKRIEDFSSVALLPLFFAFTGLRTQIGLLDGAGNWAVCALIVAVATFGKVGGATGAARWSGMSWRDSLSLGWLMNTRGLMELVVLNIGYDLGVLSPTIFSMMVVMALVTTVMTSPMVSLTQPSLDGDEEAAPAVG